MKIYKISDKIHYISHIFLLLNLFLAITSMRLGDILNYPFLRFEIYFLFSIGACLGFFSCFALNKKITCSLLLFLGAVFFHAWCIFYQPSLKTGVSVQDYILQDTFSSNFAITQTRLYLMYPTVFLFPILSFCNHALSGNKREFFSKVFLFILFSGGLLNCFVSIFQGFSSVHFLAAGSGTSVDAGRASGLLADSGESSVFFSSILVFLFLLILSENFLTKKKILYYILLVFFFLGGLATHSRIFFVATLISLPIYFLIRLGHILSGKKFKLFSSTFVECLIFLSVALFICTYHPFKIPSIYSDMLSYLSPSDFFKNYSLIDEPRAQHLKVMWQATQDHFYTGTGLGSFQGNLFYYANKLFPGKGFTLDVNTNSYFQLSSELGLVGCVVLLSIISIFVVKILDFIKASQNSEKNYFFALYYIFPVSFVLPMMICFFIGTHLIYSSVSFLSIFALATGISFQSSRKFSNAFLWTLNLCSLYLMGVCIYLAATTPRVPEFRWVQTGHNQVPLSVGSLPQPQGKMERNKIYFSELIQKYFNENDFSVPASSSEGRWMKFNNEILLSRRDFKIYIPKIETPLHIQISFLNSNGQAEHTQKNSIENAGWLHFDAPDIDTLSNCYQNISPVHYCSVQIRLQKNYLSTPVFFIENEYLFLKEK